MEIVKALGVIDRALEEYGEARGTAPSDIADKFKDLQAFFNDVCYPDWNEDGLGGAAKKRSPETLAQKI